MNEDTISLLKECNAGCKSATNSMEQVKPYIQESDFNALIEKYNDMHVQLGDECHVLLNQYNEEEKDPHVMAKAFSWLSTEVKLMMKDDTHKIAKLMMDGCNMGIQSVSEYINKYQNASKETVSLAKRLVQIEQDFMNELKEYV